MNICFLDKTSFTYNSKDINSYTLRGAETVLLNLAKSLSTGVPLVSTVPVIILPNEKSMSCVPPPIEPIEFIVSV